MHGVAGVVGPHDACLVVRTPSNPSFSWGNLLLLAAAPRDSSVWPRTPTGADVAWRARSCTAWAGTGCRPGRPPK
jgi:hypothetical protein